MGVGLHPLLCMCESCTKLVWTTQFAASVLHLSLFIHLLHLSHISPKNCFKNYRLKYKPSSYCIR